MDEAVDVHFLYDGTVAAFRITVLLRAFPPSVTHRQWGATAVPDMLQAEYSFP